MIEAGQLRQWTYRGYDRDKVFMVLEHSAKTEGRPTVSADGWYIFQTGDEPYWETAYHIERSSVPLL